MALDEPALSTLCGRVRRARRMTGEFLHEEFRAAVLLGLYTKHPGVLCDGGGLARRTVLPSTIHPMSVAGHHGGVAQL